LRDVFLEKVNKILNRYIVQFKGLKIGRHIFNFDVDNAFFDQFEESEISRGDLSVDVVLNRLSSLLEIDFNIDGDVEVLCDRCLEPFTIPTSFVGKLLIRISDSIPEEETADDVWYINSNEHEINLAQYIYESICLSLPIQRYHGILDTSADECDSTMLERLNKLSASANKDSKRTEVDHRWDKLKGLKNN
jgi:uncharacterized metal-binding protein YceD (DUF177 family)